MNKLIILLLFCVTQSVLWAQETGKVAIYADEFQGRKTANGELYDKNKNTAAHKTLPFGTYVKVTRTDNGASTVVRINDRGPYLRGRILDISRAAATELGFSGVNDLQVRIETVESPAAAQRTPPPAHAPVAEEPAAVVTTPIPPIRETPKREDTTVREEEKREEPRREEVRKPLSSTPLAEPVVAKTAPKKDKAPDKSVATKVKNDRIVKGKDYKPFDLYKIQVLRPIKEGWGVQVASLKSYENIFKKIAILQEDWYDNILVSIEEDDDKKPVYKIILGPFPDKETAESYKKHVTKKGIKGFIIDLHDVKCVKKS